VESYDVIIIGAGAAGFMCAITAGQRGRSVLLLDHSNKPAPKIRISGGGRCNFTNRGCSPANFLSKNPHFCISALSSYTQHDFIAWIERHGIAYHERNLGQLFCDGSAQQIIEMLVSEARNEGVALRLGSSVDRVARDSTGFVATGDRLAARCDSLVIATGGKSIPKMGATGFGYDIARQFGLKIIDPHPGLVPLTFDDRRRVELEHLSGISLDGVVSYKDIQFREALLFSHRGLSGPSILQISSYWDAGKPVVVDLAPEERVFEYLQQRKRSNPRQQLSTALTGVLPNRLAKWRIQDLGRDGKLAELSDTLLRECAEQIHHWKVLPSGTEGYRTAEVTIGGVDTAGLSQKTLESRSVPGLYFIGEVVDVTGWLGGYNFQWAWSSGFAAGNHA
jgi:hypothetical protein